MGPEQVAHLIQTHLPSRGCVSFSSSGKRGCGGKQEHTSTQGLSHLLCTPRCSNHERRPRPSRSAPACWSTPPPRGSRRWKPAPIASSMNCDVLEPSSPTTARSPRSSISVLVVRAQPGIWGAGGAARDGIPLKTVEKGSLPGLSPWLATDHPLPVSSCHLLSACVWVPNCPSYKAPNCFRSSLFSPVSECLSDDSSASTQDGG